MGNFAIFVAIWFGCAFAIVLFLRGAAYVNSRESESRRERRSAAARTSAKLVRH